MTNSIGSKQMVHMNYKVDLLERVDKITKKHKLGSRSQSIEYLLNTAIKIIERIESVPPIELAKELKEAHEQLKHGGLVDYAITLSDRDLKLLFDIVSDEYASRYSKNK
jgi:hypothetical protein